MPTSAQDLLELRISTLRGDVEKVRHAVELAERRNAQMGQISEIVRTSSKEAYDILQDLNGVIGQLRDFVRDNPGVEEMLSDRWVGGDAPGADVPLLQRVNGMSAQVDAIRTHVDAPRLPLLRMVRAQVDLKDRTSQLERSLDTRCRVLMTALDDLSADAATGAPRTLWSTFDTLLHEQARPLFVEYVDFLGGLTVRETGLDGRICEMSEFLLGGLASTRFVSIPASQSALSSAMDSVIKMGFPEWSVWGLPLAAHEVGVALWNDVMITDLRTAIRQQVPAECDDAELAELFGDAFAAWTMGPAYGCAALLLRLQPHGADVRAGTRPRDVDRARLILGVLRALTPPASDDGLSSAVGTLAGLWESATRTLAPAGVDDAPHEADWVDTLVAAAVQALRDVRLTYPPLTVEQWQHVEDRRRDLGREPAEAPVVAARPEALLELLNAAWVGRLEGDAGPDDLATAVTRMWQRRSQGASQLGASGTGSPVPHRIGAGRQ